MTQLTRKDLDEALKDHHDNIEKLFDAKLAPITKTLDGHQKTLYGKTGSNGLTGSVTVLKWGYGLLTLGIASLIHKVFM